ncbi:hypothetical protein [Streptomyces coffeae]|uniref:Scaffolding protein n=1 Tax=Streptomyces coffeae TaxID=621382 RepID=A0ABS1NJM7_9ACTN|nr:hypothetical protein [Streptomyces coffeae]MBL1100139.1 hypothetical protein [Streptomyces coffeae]
MHKRTLARQRLDGSAWAHPYGHGSFSPVVYADGGDGGESGSGSAGGDSSLEAAVAASTGQEGQQPAQPSGQQAGQSQPKDPWADFQWDGKVDSLPDPVAKVIREAREEAGKARVVAKRNAADEARQELLASISKAIGLDEGEQPPTPDQLTEQLRQTTGELTAAQEQAASAAIELHIFKTAQRLGANADTLLDSRAFCDAIDSLDTSDPEAFNRAVEKTINEALGRNPNLRAQPAGRSGADLNGRSGENGARKRGEGGLASAIRDHYQT